MIFSYLRLAFLFLGLTSTVSLLAQPRLTDLIRGPQNGIQFHITGMTQPTVLQASPDFRNWINLQTNVVGDVTFSDPQAASYPSRFYRLISYQAPVPNPSPVVDLSQMPNAVFPANEGFNTLQYAPAGNLAFITWKNQELIYRERVNGGWSESTVTGNGSTFTPRGYDEHRFQPLASLLFDSNSRPHVYEVSGRNILHFARDGNGNWSQAETISPNVADSITLFAVALGPNDAAHVAVIDRSWNPNIIYGSNKNGGWQFSTITTMTGDARGFLKQSYAPRFFSMAIDSGNAAHLALTREFRLVYPGQNYARPYSELTYASNRNGWWVLERVNYSADGAGDCGTGASIAIGPDGHPAIAAWWNKRVDTGSSTWSQLRFHRRDGNGNWSNEFVNGNPDAYAAGDGDKGTGFAPYLRFDNRGRPHIAFSDHAAEHFWNTGQNEYAGQIRHAYFDGGQWRFHKVYQQSNPLQKQMIYPAFAVSGNEMAFIGFERETQWVDTRNANSTYRFVFRTEALP